MRTLRWMVGITKKDKIRNECVKGTTRLTQASKNITEKYLKRSGHVMRREEEHTVKRTYDRHTRKKKDDQRPGGKASVRDMNTVGLNAVEAINRTTWRENINNHTSLHERETPGKNKTVQQQIVT